MACEYALTYQQFIIFPYRNGRAPMIRSYAYTVTCPEIVVSSSIKFDCQFVTHAMLIEATCRFEYSTSTHLGQLAALDSI